MCVTPACNARLSCVLSMAVWGRKVIKSSCSCERKVPKWKDIKVLTVLFFCCQRFIFLFVKLLLSYIFLCSNQTGHMSRVKCKRLYVVILEIYCCSCVSLIPETLEGPGKHVSKKKTNEFILDVRQRWWRLDCSFWYFCELNGPRTRNKSQEQLQLKHCSPFTIEYEQYFHREDLLALEKQGMVTSSGVKAHEADEGSTDMRTHTGLLYWCSGTHRLMSRYRS